MPGRLAPESATILAVDDEFGILEIITMALAEEGHRVVVAANGRQGLERLARGAVDLVLLDLMMPLLDGPGMLRAIQAAPALRRIPVVMMSSLSKAAMQQECAGCAAYLRKPFSIALLPRSPPRASGKGPATRRATKEANVHSRLGL